MTLLPRPLPTLLLATAVLAIPAQTFAQTLAQTSAQTSAPATPAAADPAETARLHALFARTWEEGAQRFPEWATYRGDHRYGDRLSDASLAGEQAMDAALRQALTEARSIRRDRLSPPDRVSLDMFISQYQRLLDTTAFPGLRTMTLGALGGVQNQFSELLQMVPMATAAQARQLLARMAAYPSYLDHQIERLQRGMALGFVPAAPVLDRVLAQIDAQLPAQTEAGPFWRPFTRLGRDIPEAERQALQAEGRRAIETQVQPALRKLRAFVADEYRSKAPADGAMLHYPDGARIYDMQVAHSTTTTELTARQIHDTGVKELARLRAEMDKVMQEMKFQGDFKAFTHWLNTDPQFIAASPEALLAGYREIAKRVDGELPKLFAELPRMPYAIRSMPDYMGRNRAEYYQGPAQDGSRAGVFYANAAAYQQRPTWGMETLVAHEAVPGHHLQVARAQELRGLPEFRRMAFGFTAYVEGWALYAETLGFELGLYQSPASRFGHLQAQAFRAARLVVDTGMHAYGWPRQRCIDFMVDATGMDRDFMTSEVDRYSTWPGQALGYMVGRMRFEALRDRARAALGTRFDIRRFHNTVLDQGALPLDALERVVDDWIAAQRSAG